jgi:hypothetical protein
MGLECFDVTNYLNYIYNTSYASFILYNNTEVYYPIIYEKSFVSRTGNFLYVPYLEIEFSYRESCSQMEKIVSYIIVILLILTIITSLVATILTNPSYIAHVIILCFIISIIVYVLYNNLLLVCI